MRQTLKITIIGIGEYNDQYCNIPKYIVKFIHLIMEYQMDFDIGSLTSLIN